MCTAFALNASGRVVVVVVSHPDASRRRQRWISGAPLCRAKFDAIHSRAHDLDAHTTRDRHVCDGYDEYADGDAGVRADGAPTRRCARDTRGDVVEIHAWGTRRGERA